MAFKRGRVYWTYIRQAGGARKRISLETESLSAAREMEGMLARLAKSRSWDVLEAAASRRDGIGELFDAWRHEGESLTEYRARVSDCDLNVYFDDWKRWAERRASVESVRKYASQLRVLMPEGRPFYRSSFRRREISAALQQLEWSGSTGRRYHAAWSSFANFLVESEVIEHNPLRDIRAPKSNAGRAVYLDKEDQMRLVAAQPFPFSALAALREGAGVEISAALRVRRRDVSETTRTVFVHGTKNEWRSRTVHVEDWAWPYLRQAAANKLPDALLFAGIGFAAARRRHRDALVACDLPTNYVMHDARHSLAVRWMRQGVEPHLIANNLGHRDASLVLKLYGRHRTKDEDLRRLRERGAV